MNTALVALLAVIATTQASVTPNYFSAEYIQQINEQAKTWTAGRNFPENTKLSEFKKLLGAKRLEVPVLPVKRLSESDTPVNIPDTFDAREQWSNCSVIKQIRDQSQCQSSWAVAPASMISDRICISSKGGKDIPISAADFISCCERCGKGCDGGYVEVALEYWWVNGSVTGGEYGSGVGCKPYPFPQCAHNISGSTYPACPDKMYHAPSCSKACDDITIVYERDINKARLAYGITASVEAIQIEIVLNGPVVADFTVYSDFASYKSGVYERTPSSEAIARHAVKILGWGTEGGTPYWLVANSWTEFWGDNGTFKIKREQDLIGFEDNVMTGLPDEQSLLNHI